MRELKYQTKLLYTLLLNIGFFIQKGVKKAVTRKNLKKYQISGVMDVKT